MATRSFQKTGILIRDGYMNNWLRIFNATSNEARVAVHYSQREGEADKTDERSIPPHGRLDLGIHEKAARDTYGLVQVTTSSPGTLASHVVRTHTSSSHAGFIPIAIRNSVFSGSRLGSYLEVVIEPTHSNTEVLRGLAD